VKFKNIEVHEHKCMLQVLCVCMQGIIDKKYIHVFQSYYTWYMYACRKSSYTEGDIDHLQELTRKLIYGMIIVFGEFQKSEFKLNKVHTMLHFVDDIKRGGPTSQYSANLWEHLHIHKVKTPYRASNARDANKQIFESNSNAELLDELEDFGIAYADDISEDKRTSVQQKVSSFYATYAILGTQVY
jgi:hypothetical protein